MTTSILVTGAAGYLGSIACERLLQAGYRVTALDSLLYNQQSLFHLCALPEFEFVRGDVRDGALLGRLLTSADAVVNLAAIVGAPACKQDPWAARSVNLEAVRQLNRLRSPRQLVIQPTTNSGYGARSGAIHCTEETPLEPISLYGQTKVAAEVELLQAGNAISLRLATVFGASPRMRFDLLVNDFVRRAVVDGAITLYEADFKRNYIHIRDAADCVVFCLEHAEQMAGRAYNAGLDCANLSKRELAGKVAEHVPGLCISYGETSRDPDRRNYVVSNQRLRDAGFEAQRSLDQGIQELIKACAMLSRGGLSNV